jgi:Zn-dependent protease/CBS domain-containing protein
VGAIAAVGLFASVLLHELSHSFVALARGLGVHSITLFIFGGVSNVKGEAEEPKDEFLIAVVGPLTSFVLAGLFWLARQAAAPGNTPIGALLGYLAFINLLLGGFNLVPGFPLDGGRVLRSIIWGMTGSLRRATQLASYAGQGFGFLLMFWGISRLLGGELLGGLWTAFIGWFLSSAAEATRRQQALTEDLRGMRVAEVMNPQVPLGQPDMSVQEFVFDHVLRRGRRGLLVMEDGRLLGIVSITDAKEVPQEAWSTTPVAAIMTRAPLKTLAPEADVSSALRLLVDGPNELPVVRDGQVVGLLTRVDILRFLQFRDELELGRVPGGRSRTAAAAGGVPERRNGGHSSGTTSASSRS